MSDRYYTLKRTVQGDHREKGSKFFAFAMPVRDREEMESELRSVQEYYPDASHHCYAFRIGIEAEQEHVNDDGEPKGSAGQPIMNAVRSYGLKNVLIVVARYFGGSKLGKRGLIDAYRAAAEDALKKGRVLEKRVLEWFRLEHPHESTGQVEALLRKHRAEEKDASYQEKVSRSVAVPIPHKEAFMEEIKGVKGVKVEEAGPGT